MNQHTTTLDSLAEYLRAGWAKAVANPNATAEQKVAGSLKGTFLMWLEDHGADSLLNFAEDYNAHLTALDEHPATPHAVRRDLSHLIVTTEVVIARLRHLK